MIRRNRCRSWILAFAGVAILSPVTAGSVAAQALPDAATIIRRYVEAMGGDELRDKQGMVTEGTFSLPAMGTTGAMEVSHARPNHLVLHMTLPGIGDLRSGFDGTVGWSLNPLEGPRVLNGNELEQVRDDADFSATLRDARVVESMETIDKREVEGQACYRVRIVWKSGRETFDCYAIESGLLISTDLRTETVMGTVDATVLFSDYREFDGVRVPTRTVQKVMGQEMVMTVDSVRFESIDPAVFELPAEIKALVRG
ncbi:MAG: hypothetical protein PVH00_07825 [Gemmatimonadota bacterium]|jgi:hypothetical protein